MNPEFKYVLQTLMVSVSIDATKWTRVARFLKGVQRCTTPHAVQFKKMTANIEWLFQPPYGVMRAPDLRESIFVVPAKPGTYDKSVGQMSQQCCRWTGSHRNCRTGIAVPCEGERVRWSSSFWASGT